MAALCEMLQGCPDARRTLLAASAQRRPGPSYTTAESQKPAVTRSPAGGAAGRATVTGREAAQALSPGSAVPILSAGMAQKLGEWAKAPGEATGLYRAMLLRSGKWGSCHHWDHPSLFGA